MEDRGEVGVVEVERVGERAVDAGRRRRRQPQRPAEQARGRCPPHRPGLRHALRAGSAAAAPRSPRVERRTDRRRAPASGASPLGGDSPQRRVAAAPPAGRASRTSHAGPGRSSVRTTQRVMQQRQRPHGRAGAADELSGATTNVKRSAARPRGSRLSISTIGMPSSTSSIRWPGSRAWPTPAGMCSNAVVSEPTTRGRSAASQAAAAVGPGTPSSWLRKATGSPQQVAQPVRTSRAAPGATVGGQRGLELGPGTAWPGSSRSAPSAPGTSSRIPGVRPARVRRSRGR